MWNPEKKKVLDTAFNQIEKQFGKGAIMKMDDTSRPLVPVISSGNIALDVVLGTGGYPVGRISSGKTTLIAKNTIPRWLINKNHNTI